MPTTGELSGRKQAILRTLVRQFIRTGEPVGSEVIVSAAHLGVSSATIRNELAALEEMGYLMQPHTSAGRMPTDLGYRYYVDLLPSNPRLRYPEKRAIVRFFDEALADVDEILRGTTHLLSRLTRNASLALPPSRRSETVAHAELVTIGSGTLLLIVLDSGHVEKRLLDVPEGVTEARLAAVSRVVGEACRGSTLHEAAEAVEAKALKARALEKEIFGSVAAACRGMESAAGAEHVVMGGVANIATGEAFDRRDTLRDIFEALERESEILSLLRDAATSQAVTVTIGRENPVTGMWEVSMVAAPYEVGGATGTIGVVGPVRMDYEAAISAVRAVSERLSAAVEALGG